MQLFVTCQQRHLVDVSEFASVASIKSVIAAQEGIPAAAQYVTFQGRVLEDGLLSAQGVDNLSSLEVGCRILGGKVHGSLARAGKVKAQTPKVDKQTEGKKKKKTGRAKRRAQYNKRFVNVVAAFGGKRKGPNSNSD